jgi:hypothetical protein
MRQVSARRENAYDYGSKLELLANMERSLVKLFNHQRALAKLDNV